MIEWDLGLVGIGEVTQKPIPITLGVEDNWAAWRERADTYANAWIESVRFFPKAGNICLIPGRDGKLARVVVGATPKPDFWSLAALPCQLPQGTYVLDSENIDVSTWGGVALGWALGAYQFTRYKVAERLPAQLLVTDKRALSDARRLASATYLVRDLINTPANDMGPAELAMVA